MTNEVSPHFEEEFYTTKDIVIAATLICLKFPFKNADIEYAGTKRKIYWFKFDNTERLRDAVTQTMNRQINVEPFFFSQNLRMLKSLMVNERENPRNF
jgi:hypothetical protein